MQSMTGFHAFCEKNDSSYTWNLRSVNAKGLDIRLKLPIGFEELEIQIRQQLKALFIRGNISISLEIKEEKQNQSYQINQDFLKQLCETSINLSKAFPALAPAHIHGLLCVNGVVQPLGIENIDKECLFKNLLNGFSQAALGLKNARINEGEKIALCLKAQIKEMEECLIKAQNLSATQPQNIKQTLLSRLKEIKENIELDEDKFLQEVCLYMLRADITEELDRIKAHLETITELLNKEEAIGRNLDFLCQELNRETNTLCSKSCDIELTKIGLSLKTLIDKFKEQIQNIQ